MLRYRYAGMLASKNLRALLDERERDLRDMPRSRLFAEADAILDWSQATADRMLATRVSPILVPDPCVVCEGRGCEFCVRVPA